MPFPREAYMPGILYQLLHPQKPQVKTLSDSQLTYFIPQDATINVPICLGMMYFDLIICTTPEAKCMWTVCCRTSRGNLSISHFCVIFWALLLTTATEPVGRAGARIAVLLLRRVRDPLVADSVSLKHWEIAREKEPDPSDQGKWQEHHLSRRPEVATSKLCSRVMHAMYFSHVKGTSRFTGHLYSLESLADTASISCLDAEAIWNAPPHTGSHSFYLYLLL